MPANPHPLIPSVDITDPTAWNIANLLDQATLAGMAVGHEQTDNPAVWYAGTLDSLITTVAVLLRNSRPLHDPGFEPHEVVGAMIGQLIADADNDAAEQRASTQ
jgi:hypothetical protein